jgi:hypothetical protein
MNKFNEKLDFMSRMIMKMYSSTSGIGSAEQLPSETYKNTLEIK